MPRKNSLPGYLQHKATGQAYVYLNGHPHYLGRWGSEESKAHYERLGYELVDYDAFPPSAQNSWQYRVVQRRGKEWGVIAMAKDV